MAQTLEGRFDTRRQAEMAIERMVQEYGVDRAAIMVIAAGTHNSAGTERSGSDNPAGSPSEAARDDAALAGAVLITVDLEDSAAQDVGSAFAEFSAHDVEQR